MIAPPEMEAQTVCAIVFCFHSVQNRKIYETVDIVGVLVSQSSNFGMFRFNSDDDESNSDSDEEGSALEMNDGQIFVPEDDSSGDSPPSCDPYPSTQKKKEILEFFRGKQMKAKSPKRKTLEQVRHRYPKISNLRTLYNWEKQFAEGSSMNIGHFPI